MELTFENFVNTPDLNSQELGDLVLFDYSRTIQFERRWNEITKEARGIVFDKVTKQVILRPLPKFHNFEEIEFQEVYKTIPKDEPFLITKKEDGSLGIVGLYNNEILSITRGSFQSEQCKWAKQWLDKTIDKSLLNPDYTYLFEIIYPENRIVIDYKGFEGLILLAIRNKVTGDEIPYNDVVEIGKTLGVKVVESFPFNSFEELFAARDTLDINNEGFVILYPRLGIRFKLKGAAYCAAHKIIANLTPLAFHEAFDLEIMRIPLSYLVIIPEEFREVSDKLNKIVSKLHLDIWNQIVLDAAKVPYGMTPKDCWFYCQDHFGPENGPLVKAFLDNKLKTVRLAIHKRVRPVGNKFDGIEVPQRLKRIIEEG